MGRSPCCDETGLKKGPWTLEEDQRLVDHIQKHGHGSWRALPKLAGLNRCGKSCRLRWTNYLRPDIKRGKFSPEEERTILNLHSVLGNKWSAIATHLPGRTDNEIKNFWNTHLKKKLIRMGLDPVTHCPRTDFLAALPALLAIANNLRELANGRRAWDDRSARLQATELQHLLQSAAASQGGSPAPSSIDNNLEFNDDIAHRDDEYLLLLLLQSELQNPSCYDHHQPALSNHEASQMNSSSCFASLPRSRTLVSLPPLTDHHVSVANLSGDTTSSCGGSPGISSFVWPDLLLDDPFMNEFA